jgi:chemotaxis protein methyltransferase CheR
MTPDAWTDPAYEAVAGWLQARTGLYFNPHRRHDAEAGIRRVMTKAGIDDVALCRQLLGSQRLPLDDFITELTVGETYFFRDPGQFEFIRHELLPQIRRRHGHDHAIRAWSAGCASGEEAYSLAILFEQEMVDQRFTILATDISRAALARARAASYGSWSLRGDDGMLADRYFRRGGDRLLLAERFRQKVNFEYLNLALDHYPSLASGAWGMDLILCRNVLIYFDRETGRRVMRALIDSLADGGVLIMGPSDPVYQEEGPHEIMVTPAGVFYRHERRPRSTLRGWAQKLEWPPEPPKPAPPASWDRKPAPPPDRDQAPPAAEPADLLAQARAAAARGDHAKVIELTRRSRAADPHAAVLHLQALANSGDALEAEKLAGAAIAAHPLTAELHFLHAMLLIGLDRNEEAERALQRTLYLDRSLAVAHLALGSVLRRIGDLAGARRAYRRGRDLAAGKAADEAVPLSEGETAGRLTAAAKAQLALIGDDQGGRP